MHTATVLFQGRYSVLGGVVQHDLQGVGSREARPRVHFSVAGTRAAARPRQHLALLKAAHAAVLRPACTAELCSQHHSPSRRVMGVSACVRAACACDCLCVDMHAALSAAARSGGCRAGARAGTRSRGEGAGCGRQAPWRRQRAAQPQPEASSGCYQAACGGRCGSRLDGARPESAEQAHSTQGASARPFQRPGRGETRSGRALSHAAARGGREGTGRRAPPAGEAA